MRNNPVNRTDFMGLWDEDTTSDTDSDYKLNKNGKIELIKATEDKTDRLFATDKAGKEVIKNDIPLGILSELTKDKSNPNTKYEGTYAKTKNNTEATRNLFEFIYNHSSVEWGFNKYKEGESVIYTSWKENSIVRDGRTERRNNIPLRKEFGIRLGDKITDTHTHTLYSAPSTDDGKGGGDIPFKNKQSNYAPDIQFYIYYKGDYHPY